MDVLFSIIVLFNGSALLVRSGAKANSGIRWSNLSHLPKRGNREEGKASHNTKVREKDKWSWYVFLNTGSRASEGKSELIFAINTLYNPFSPPPTPKICGSFLRKSNIFFNLVDSLFAFHMGMIPFHRRQGDFTWPDLSVSALLYYRILILSTTSEPHNSCVNYR